MSLVPGAIGLLGVGVGGSVTDEYQGRLESKMQELTHGDQLPVVVMGWTQSATKAATLHCVWSRSVTRTFTGTAGVVRRVK